jgi:hypothetical protein
VGKKGFFEKARETRTRQQARKKLGGTPPRPRPQTDGPKRKIKAEEVKKRVARKRATRNKKGASR